MLEFIGMFDLGENLLCAFFSIILLDIVFLFYIEMGAKNSPGFVP